MCRTVLPLFLLLAGPLWAGDVTIDGPDAADPGTMIVMKVKGLAAKAGVRWTITPALDATHFAPNQPKGQVCWTAAPAVTTTYTVQLDTGSVNAEGEFEFGGTAKTVTVKGVSPAPVPPAPVPPGPTPPAPTPGTSPFAGAGLRVLIVVETADLPKMPAAQQVILYGGRVRDYLNTHCVAGPKLFEWRAFDQNQDVSNEPKNWQDAMKRPRASLPWLLIGNGTSGYEGPLPATEAEFLALVQKYEVK